MTDLLRDKVVRCDWLRNRQLVKPICETTTKNNFFSYVILSLIPNINTQPFRAASANVLNKHLQGITS